MSVMTEARLRLGGRLAATGWTQYLEPSCADAGATSALWVTMGMERSNDNEDRFQSDTSQS